MWIDDIKKKPTPEAWDIVKTAIPEVSGYANKSGFSRKSGLEILKIGYEAGVGDTQNFSSPSRAASR